jgi:NADH:ubiquinone oxidoreductase subunit E
MPLLDLQICSGIYCSVRGGQELLDILDDHPEIKQNCNITYVKCLECCEGGKKSPVIQLEGVFYEKMTPEKLITLLSSKIR